MAIGYTQTSLGTFIDQIGPNASKKSFTYEKVKEIYGFTPDKKIRKIDGYTDPKNPNVALDHIRGKLDNLRQNIVEYFTPKVAKYTIDNRSKNWLNEDLNTVIEIFNVCLKEYNDIINNPASYNRNRIHILLAVVLDYQDDVFGKGFHSGGNITGNDGIVYKFHFITGEYDLSPVRKTWKWNEIVSDLNDKGKGAMPGRGVEPRGGANKANTANMSPPPSPPPSGGKGRGHTRSPNAITPTALKQITDLLNIKNVYRDFNRKLAATPTIALQKLPEIIKGIYDNYMKPGHPYGRNEEVEEKFKALGYDVPLVAPETPATPLPESIRRYVRGIFFG
jgi:hypothetical protein